MAPFLSQVVPLVDIWKGRQFVKKKAGHTGLDLFCEIAASGTSRFAPDLMRPGLAHLQPGTTSGQDVLKMYRDFKEQVATITPSNHQPMEDSHAENSKGRAGPYGPFMWMSK